MRLGLLAALALVANAASPVDLSRARRQTPGPRTVGEGHVGMASTLNKAIRSLVDNVKECDSFTMEELLNLQRVLHDKRDPAMEAIYRETGDKGRSMRTLGEHTADLVAIEELWKKEMLMHKQYPQLVKVSRDVKCHEAVMWFVHHLPAAGREELRRQITLPLLPERDRHQPKAVPAEVAARFSHQEVQFPPSGGLACDEAHATQGSAKNNEYVEWPQEVTYTATGFGNFPFWDNSATAGCGSCDHKIDTPSQVKTLYSSKLNSEIIMHSSCGDMTWTGASSAPNKSPCNHIFTPDQGAFIYTPKTSLSSEADGAFCCRSVPVGSTNFPGAVPRDWMKTATYAGTYQNFVGTHYSGVVKMFTWQIGAHLQFWYYAKPDGTPVQQGESGQQPNGGKPVATAGAVTLFHDWNTFENATFTSSDFTVPDVCKSTKYSCSAPGTDTAAIVV